MDQSIIKHEKKEKIPDNSRRNPSIEDPPRAKKTAASVTIDQNQMPGAKISQNSVNRESHRQISGSKKKRKRERNRQRCQPKTIKKSSGRKPRVGGATRYGSGWSIDAKPKGRDRRRLSPSPVASSV
ncbi:hypothetical protein GW17_00000359 [Ensete ventricosum]|nr:hypothetical protein GW17_00000359 [Ensete ventricosum]